MSLTPDEAAFSLRAVSQTQKRSREAYSYSQSAPYCFVWGLVWLLGYGAEAYGHSENSWAWVGWSWMALTIAGVAASIVIGRLQSRRHAHSGWRMGVLFLILYAFTFALFSVLHPVSNLQIGAYFPLLFAAIYAGIGLWLGIRYILVGAFMAVATLAAYFLLREYFFVWMALVGGGSLILTGFWLRQA